MLSTILDYIGGEREIRTLDTCFSTYAPLAGEYLRPLGQLTLNFNLAPRPGLEPGTCGLTVRRSTD